MVLEDGKGRQVGHIAVEETVSGVLTFGMAILPEARGQGGGRALVGAAQTHARAIGAHKISIEVWIDNTAAISLSMPPPGSRSKGFDAITTAERTVASAAR